MRKRINRIIGLSCITVLCMCIFASCVKKPSPNEESSAAEEKSTQSGDNKASDIPTLSEVTSYSDDQMINLSKELDEDTLIKVWGEPFKTQYQRIWKIEQDGKTKYVEAFVMDGKVESLNNSVAMYAVVAKKHGGEIYCFLDWNDYIIDSGKLCHLPGSDVYGNSIDCEIGDRLLLQSNGIIIETYPGDIANPYEAIPQGKVSDEDMKRIESSMSSTGVFVEENVPANDESEGTASIIGPYGKISLKVPKTWSYEIANVDDEKLITGCYGIILKPNGTGDGQLEVVIADNFAVCGTGLVNEKKTLAGSPVKVGTYDGEKHWSFIVFEGDNPQVVVNHTDGTSWKDSTWDEAWSILDTISFDRNKTQGGIGQFNPESEDPDIAVIMTVKNVTPTGLTVHFWQYENKDIGELDYGEDFTLEKLEGDTWVLLPQIIDNAAFTLVAYVIPPGGEAEMDVNWEWLYGKLEPGTYRINKTVLDHRSDRNLYYPLRTKFYIAESN